MSFTGIFASNYSSGSDVITKEVTITDEAQNNLDVDVADGITDGLHAFELDYSQLKGFYLVSSQDVTVKTNSDSVPDDTFALLADQPIAWNELSGLTNPVGTDITALYITNASGSTATIQFRTIFDPTV